LGGCGKLLLEKMADIRGGFGFLKPGLNVREGFSGESLFWEQNTGPKVSGRFKAISREKVRQNILFPGKVLNHEVGLRERFPPTTKASVMRL